MVEAINNLIKFIVEKEGRIAKYSDKLRRTAKQLSNLFNYASKCAVCGYEIIISPSPWMKNAVELPSQSEKEYQEILNKFVKKAMGHDELFNDPKYQPYTYGVPLHTFVPAVDVSFFVVDKESFYQSGEHYYFLAFDEHRLKAFLVQDPERKEFYIDKELHEISRAALKALFNSGRIIAFLRQVQDFLVQKEGEYMEAEKQAEKISEAISILTAKTA